MEISKAGIFEQTYQISAFLPYPSPLMTSGLIQYGVPVTDFIPVPERQMLWSRLLAPKSPSLTLPVESRRIFAPKNKKHPHFITFIGTLEYNLKEQWQRIKRSNWLFNLSPKLGCFSSSEQYLSQRQSHKQCSLRTNTEFFRVRNAL